MRSVTYSRGYIQKATSNFGTRDPLTRSPDTSVFVESFFRFVPEIPLRDLPILWNFWGFHIYCWIPSLIHPLSSSVHFIFARLRLSADPRNSSIYIRYFENHLARLGFEPTTIGSGFVFEPAPWTIRLPR